MAKKVSAMEIRRNFGEIMDQVYLMHEEFVVERAGKTLAKIVPMGLDNNGKLDFRDILKLPGI